MGKGRDALKLAIGRVAEFAMPHLGREIDEDRNPQRAPRLKRAIHYARLRRAHARGDASAMDAALVGFWKGGPGDRFHGSFTQERFSLFLDQHAVGLDRVAALLEDAPGSFSRLVEVGCGDGQVLAECAARLPSIPHLVGLDINAGVVARAASEHGTDGRLSFLAADARTWLASNPQPGTVMVANGGVLEYFSQDNVDRLLQALAAAPPAMVMLVEPAAPNHDLQTQPQSFAFGHEYSFSHNHRRRLGDAGFEVVFEKETDAANARLIVTIGVLKRGPQEAPPGA